MTVRETVPDSVFERADEIELVDLAPDDLLERLREGKVYVPTQATRHRALFPEGKSDCLSELALRKVAERVDAQMASYRREHKIEETWPVSERLLVCVSPSPMSRRCYAPRAGWLRACAPPGSLPTSKRLAIFACRQAIGNG